MADDQDDMTDEQADTTAEQADTADTAELVAEFEEFYARFNARDIEWCLGRMAPDVDWHNAMEGRREVGRDAVRDYWTRQFSVISSTVTPLEVRRDADAVFVRVDQVVRLPDGAIRSHTEVQHRFDLDADGLVRRFDAIAIPAPSA